MEKIATENRRKQTIFLFYFLQIKRFKLTRVRRIENLYFDPMPSLPRLRSMAKTKVFAERRKQDEREKASDAKYVAEAQKKMQ